MNGSSIFSIFFLLVLFNCNPAKEQSENTKAKAEEQTFKTNQREPTDDEIREFGRLTEIEDGAYPMFSLNLEFPERQTTEGFSLNIESISLDIEGLMAMKGQYATIYDTSDEEPDIYDIHRECESLLGEYAIDINEADKEITGILSGAASISNGDLPDEITITAGDGTEVTFKCFISDEVAAANGDEVTVFYATKYVNNVTYILPSKPINLSFLPDDRRKGAAIPL